MDDLIIRVNGWRLPQWSFGFTQEGSVEVNAFVMFVARRLLPAIGLRGISFDYSDGQRVR